MTVRRRARHPPEALRARVPPVPALARVTRTPAFSPIPIAAPPRARAGALAGWRALPLTAQLGVVGAVVTIAWFLAARTATDRQEADAAARRASLADLHRDEVLATRLGSEMATMSAAQARFLLTGREELVAPLEVAYRRFGSDADLLLARAEPFGGLARDVRRLRDRVRLWHDSVAVPNLALMRRAGETAFDPGTAGAARLLRGAAIMGSAADLQAIVLRDLREAARAEEVAAETAEGRDEIESFLIRAAAVAIFLLVGTLILRLVQRSLSQVVVAAQALEDGHYADARLPDADHAPNREMAALARTFERVAESIATRERQLQEDIEKLKELDRLKADFVSTVSHELRTPLTSMRGALGLLLAGETGELPPKGRDLLQIAMTNTERLIRLINDILDIEKIDAGKIVMRHDRLHLRPVLEGTIAGIEAFATQARVTVRLADDADAEVLGDADRLVQVFTNLISNAVKFSPPGATVDVTLLPAGDAVTVQVRDRGPGIPEEFAPRIFGRFQQAENAESRRSGGTGLGLSIAKAIVELHGGQVGFRPAPVRGTIFWVSLPVMAPAARADDPRPAVLIVEDDPAMREVLVAQVESLARPVAVATAEEALALLAQEAIAAVVIDPGLPGMGGLELARRLRDDERLRRLPILVFSAQEHTEQDLRAHGVRAADAFVKARDAEDALLSRLASELRRGGVSAGAA